MLRIPLSVKAFKTTSVVDEATRQDRKKRTAPANQQEGTTSQPNEVLDKQAKKRTPPAHSGPGSTSHERENLDARKKRPVEA